ncbi:MAG: DUF2793 domain-containing protein [Synergistaceae bacterium]|nr:DUF2793 domain-containing protein [Synergistaceae bacterium]
MLDRRFVDINLFVNKIANAPDDNPTAGTQYIVGSTPTGAFEGATANYIARYDGTAWKFTPPKVGSFEILNVETGEFLNFNGTAWTAVTSLSGTSGEDKEINVVDDLILGLENSTKHFELPAGRKHNLMPILYWAPGTYNNSYNLSNFSNCDIVYEGEIQLYSAVALTTNVTNKKYASCLDGKIYQVSDADVEDSLIQTDIENGAFIFNRTNNTLYIYDGTNKEFIKVIGKTFYTIDGFVDWVDDHSSSFPEDFDVVGTKVYWIGGSAGPTEITEITGKDNWNANVWSDVIYFSDGLDEQDPPIYYASIRSTFCNYAGIYQPFASADSDYASSLCIRLYDGDLLLNKEDNCIYVYDENARQFVKIKEAPSASGGTYTPVAPVLAIVPTGTTLPATAAEGDKFLKTDDAKLYTATAVNTWNAGVTTANGDRYASSTDHKIYQSDGTAVSASDIALGDIFLNKADNIIYSYDGTNFISSVEGFSYSPLAPVLNIVATGTTLPATATRGDKFLNTNNAKLYTATGNNLWNSGSATANGARYASSTDFKIYESNGTTVTASDIALGEMFLNKADNTAYSFDGSAYINIGVTAQSAIETHTLTAEDVTGKSFELTHSIKTGKENEVLLSLGGMLLTAGTDFIALENIISWNGKELDNFGLHAGDVFTIQYLY